MTVYSAAGTLATVALLAGCGGGESTSEGTSAEAGSGTSSASETSASSEAEEAKETPEGCEEITKEFGESILDETPEGATPLKYVGGAAVASPRGSGVYYGAIRFDDSQGEETGVLASTSLDGGALRSVDGFAKEVTRWPAEEGMDISAPRNPRVQGLPARSVLTAE